MDLVTVSLRRYAERGKCGFRKLGPWRFAFDFTTTLSLIVEIWYKRDARTDGKGATTINSL